MQDIQQDENAHCTCVSEKDFFYLQSTRFTCKIKVEKQFKIFNIYVYCTEN